MQLKYNYVMQCSWNKITKYTEWYPIWEAMIGGKDHSFF